MKLPFMETYSFFNPMWGFTAIHNVDGDFNISSNLMRLMDIFTFQFLFSSLKKSKI